MAVKMVLGSFTKLDQTKRLLNSRLTGSIGVKAQTHHLATTLDLSGSVNLMAPNRDAIITCGLTISFCSRALEGRRIQGLSFSPSQPA